MTAVTKAFLGDRYGAGERPKGDGTELFLDGEALPAGPQSFTLTERRLPLTLAASSGWWQPLPGERGRPPDIVTRVLPRAPLLGLQLSPLDRPCAEATPAATSPKEAAPTVSRPGWSLLAQNSSMITLCRGGSGKPGAAVAFAVYLILIPMPAAFDLAAYEPLLAAVDAAVALDPVEAPRR